MSIQIIPAIIPKSFKDLREKMSLVDGLVSIVQVDVMDGKLTPEASWPYLNSEDPDFVSIKKEDKEFPFLESLEFEVDLMIKNPENLWFDWVIAGARRLIFHFESSPNIAQILTDCRNRLVPKESILYTEVGLAIDIETPNEKIYPLVELVDFVQFMGIAEIGFQGEPFDERVIQKIKDFKSKFSQVPVSVDGGVNLKSAPALVSAGANRLVSGSTIFESDNISETIRELKGLG